MHICVCFKLSEYTACHTDDNLKQRPGSLPCNNIMTPYFFDFDAPSKQTPTNTKLCKRSDGIRNKNNTIVITAVASYLCNLLLS